MERGSGGREGWRDGGKARREGEMNEEGGWKDGIALYT